MKETEVEKTKRRNTRRNLNCLLSKIPFLLLDPSGPELTDLKAFGAGQGPPRPFRDGGLSISPLPIALRLAYPGHSLPEELRALQRWFPAELERDKISPLLTTNKCQPVSS